VADVHDFGYGLITPVVAYLLSALGCALGFLIAKKARGASRPGRSSLLALASVAIGVAGVWLPHVIGLLGVTVPGGVVRYDAAALLTSLAVAVLNVGLGIFIVGFGRRKWWRVIVAGPIVALGLIATEFIAMSALRINGTITIDRTMVTTRAVLAVVMAGAVLWCANQLNHLGASIIAGLAMGAAFTMLHYLDLVGLTMQPSTSGTAMVGGLTKMMLFIPLVLLGTVTIVLVAYFSIGNSTMHELHSIYRPGAADLEPDLVREVTSRIAGGATIDPRQIGAVMDPRQFGAAAAATNIRTRRGSALPRPIRPRPTPGTFPTWRSMPVWGFGEAETERIPLPVTNARDLRRRHHPGAAAQRPDAPPEAQWGAPDQLMATTTVLPTTLLPTDAAPATTPNAAPNTALNGKTPASAVDDPTREARRRNQRR
jgi:NO-binding membrane sensor protein with MHYT domain